MTCELNHPGDEVLRALSLGQLEEAELDDISAHLGECPTCCRRMDELATDDRLLTRLQQSAACKEEGIASRAERRRAIHALRKANGAMSERQVPDHERVSVKQAAPSQIGDYDILAEVGRGGMGVVYKALHRGLHRLAALKMVLAGEFASPTQELRFRLEAELAARVQHPNIVQVHEIGRYEGRPFLVLEWVEGGSLADQLESGKPWPPAEAASLIETLARAIDVAHVQGVVHRDLKPGNILMQRDEGEHGPSFIPHPSSSIPVPKITDFGLAQTREGGRAMTQTGYLAGTPEYMAPEQAAGKRALVGPATDIYALGVMLYQLLTGQLPIQRDSTLELLQAVTFDEPVRPRRLQPSLPRDLEAITMHCLEKEPARRYSSSLALAEDLQRFREGKQVAARPVGRIARLARACRRRPLVAALFALLIISLFGGLGGITWQWLEANQQRDLANAHAWQAEAEKQAALYQTYRASLAAASAALENHDVTDAARHLRTAPEDLRGWEWRHLQSRLDESSSVMRLPPGRGSYLIAFPDRLRVGVLTDTGLRITDLDGSEFKTVSLSPEHRDHLIVAQTRRGLRVAVWVKNTVLDVLDDAGQVLSRVSSPDNRSIHTFAMSRDGTRMAAALMDGHSSLIAVYDATSGKQTALCKGQGDTIWTLTFSPDGSVIASGAGGDDPTARLWDATSGKLLATCEGHRSKLDSVAFSPDGSRLVTSSSDRTVRQWDTKTGKEIGPEYDRHSSEVYSAVYSPDGQWIASAGADRTIRVWGAQGRRDVAMLHGHTGRMAEVAFDPSGLRLASLSCKSPWIVVGDDTVRVWDVDPQATLPTLRGHTRGIYPVVYSPDGRWIASGSWDNTARLWDAVTGEPRTILDHDSFIWSLAFGPDGTWLASASDAEDRLRIWDVETARVRKEIPLPGGTIHSLVVSPDGKRVAATQYNPMNSKERVIVFDIASSRSLFSTEGSALAYSPDGRWLAIRGADEKTVLLLDVQTHETFTRFSGHENTVFKAAFSPDSRSLATCSRDHTVRLWAIDDGTCRVLRGHSDEVYAVAFHPDGTRLASAGREGAITLWDLERGEEVVRLPWNKSFVWSLAFSPDGKTLASGGGDCTVGLWDTTLLKSRYQARREAEALRPEAERLVEQLWREKNNPAEVVKTLRAGHMASEALRQAALSAVLRRAQPQETIPHNSQDPP